VTGRLCPLIVCLLVVLSVAGHPTERSDVEILWDVNGVPHIFAGSETAAAYGFGWAQMQSRGKLLLRLYGEAQGRASEYWGPGQQGEHIRTDRWIAMMDIPARAHAWFERNGPDEQAYITAFASGINAYAEQHAQEIPSELRRVLPIRPEDVLAHTMRMLQFDFLAEPAQIRSTIAAWREFRAQNPEGPLELLDRSLSQAPPAAPGGSTGWAIGPAKSASGRAMLLINPHLPWQGRDTLYEAHLVAGRIDFYGATLLGFPVLAMGFNDHLGWTHTVNTIDGADLYELSVVNGGYQWDNDVAPFQLARHVIRVRQPDGQLRDERLDVMRSIHGPVIARVKDKALSLRVSGLDCPFVIAQYLQMMRATNATEFVAAVRSLQIPIFTILYADRDVHILMSIGGRTPARPRGDWDYWRYVVPGDSSATLWTRTLDFGELPLVRDPPSGWLQNANEPPWTATLPPPLDPKMFPAYIAPRLITYRAQRSLRFLEGDGRLTFDDVVRGKFSTDVELADHVLGALITAARSSGQPKAVDAASILDLWNRKVDAESRGAVLFEQWIKDLGGAPKQRIPWTPDAPLSTPAELADPGAAVTALVEAADEVAAAYGSADVSWGEVHRLSRGDIEEPAAGAADPLGVLRSLSFSPAANGHLVATGGDSFIAVVEFADQPRAEALLTYDNSSKVDAVAGSAQLSLYNDARLRPVWKQRRDIEQHLKDRTPLTVQ